jgi:hypothetical protein
MAWDKDTIGFSVVADNTEPNRIIIQGFKDFCEEQTQGNYTLGLKQLLSNWYSDYKNQMLYDRITELEFKLSQYESKKEQNVERDNTF